jgi:uncharacterized protein YlxW (UPF0749 family)
MNNPFYFVITILFMIFAFQIVKHKLGIPDDRRRRRGWEQAPGSEEDSAETLRLRQEVTELKERIKVLERITVEKENSLSRQIEELRDR